MVGVIRVYQQILEKVCKNDWRMLITEVANAYERENLDAIASLKDTIIDREKKIHQQKMDM